MGVFIKLNKIKRFIANPIFYRNLFYNLWQSRRLIKPPVIICGCPRSGTTLLMAILDSHPEIHVVPFETAVFQKRSIEKRVFKGVALNRWFVKMHFRSYLFSTKIKRTAKRWCEKTPVNILNVHEIDLLFNGRIKFINIFRDGRAVMASRHSRFGYMVSPDLWKKCVTEGIAHAHRNNFFNVHYEDIINNTSGTLKSIENFLGLQSKFNEKWFDTTSIKGRINSVVNGRTEGSMVSEGINASNVLAWKESPSLYLAQFLSDEQCLSLNRSLGHE